MIWPVTCTFPGLWPFWGTGSTVCPHRPIPGSQSNQDHSWRKSSWELRENSSAFSSRFWLCIMRVADCSPDANELLQFVLGLAAEKCFLCSSLTGQRRVSINGSHFYFILVSLWHTHSTLVITTKLHRLLCHVRDHLKFFGCRLQGASKENEMLHKLVKKIYKNTKKYIAHIALQLLRS